MTKGLQSAVFKKFCYITYRRSQLQLNVRLVLKSLESILERSADFVKIAIIDT